MDLEEDLNLHRNKDGKYVIDDEWVKAKAKEAVSGNNKAMLFGLCGEDLSGFDMSGLSPKYFRMLTFDEETTFSDEQKDKFSPEGVIEQGKNFANVKDKNSLQFDGTGTIIAILDRYFDSSIEEFNGRVIKHVVFEKDNDGKFSKTVAFDRDNPQVKDSRKAFEKKYQDDAWHGLTTASLAAGSQCGVVPKAELYIFSIGENMDWQKSADAMFKYIRQETKDGNMEIPDVISASGPVEEISDEDEAWLKENGCDFISSKEFRENFTLGRINESNKIVLEEYAKEIYGREWPKGTLPEDMKEKWNNNEVAVIPSAGRTSVHIGKNGKPVYKYNGSLGGNSFAICQTSGLLSGAKSKNSSIKFDRFIKILKKPGKLNQEGMRNDEYVKAITEDIKNLERSFQEQEIGKKTVYSPIGKKDEAKRIIEKKVKERAKSKKIGMHPDSHNGGQGTNDGR